MLAAELPAKVPLATVPLATVPLRAELVRAELLGAELGLLPLEAEAAREPLDGLLGTVGVTPGLGEEALLC